MPPVQQSRGFTKTYLECLLIFLGVAAVDLLNGSDILLEIADRVLPRLQTLGEQSSRLRIRAIHQPSCYCWEDAGFCPRLSYRRRVKVGHRIFGLGAESRGRARGQRGRRRRRGRHVQLLRARVSRGRVRGEGKLRPRRGGKQRVLNYRYSGNAERTVSGEDV